MRPGFLVFPFAAGDRARIDATTMVAADFPCACVGRGGPGVLADTGLATVYRLDPGAVFQFRTKTCLGGCMATGLPAHLSERDHEWVLDFCSFRSAWSKSKGAGITIAHPDTGWTMHPELVAPRYLRDRSINFFEPIRYSRYYALLDDPPSARDHDGFLSSAHGTGTAGVIVSPQGAPAGSTGKFVSGAAPDATVIPFRVAENPWMRHPEDAALAKCIYHCIGLRDSAGIDVAVMSVSLGGIRTGTEKKVKDALVAARKAGIVVIAAAGQVPGHGGFFGRRLPVDIWFPMFPGSSADTICVAGCDKESKPLQLAFYGEEVDISAPAVKVWMSRTKWRDEAPQGEEYQVEQSDGTSYSTALTAAACALWQSAHTRNFLIEKYQRHRLLEAFRYCLKHSADRPDGWETSQRGGGVLNVEKLLDFELPSVGAVDSQLR
jgi:thermitase